MNTSVSGVSAFNVCDIEDHANKRIATRPMSIFTLPTHILEPPNPGLTLTIARMASCIAVDT